MAVNLIREVAQELGPTLLIDRSILPGTPFLQSDVVIAIGQDGLVANTLRYAHSLPIIGVNPDPHAYEGRLLPVSPTQAAKLLVRRIKDPRTQVITLGSAHLSTGAKLIAANDIFVGKSNHTSALYRIRYKQEEEAQSSSGVIISTPLGGSGWQRSIIAGAAGISAQLDGREKKRTPPVEERLDSGRLRFWVREPWTSLQSQADILTGQVDASQPLEIISEMGEDGVIFADGIVEDSFPFPAGAHVKITPSSHQGRLVIAQ